MLRISKLTDYCIVLMAYFAQHPHQDYNARELSASTGIAQPTVSKLLKKLTQSGLLVSHRGAKGGYTLAKTAEEISIAAIIDVMEGKLALTECNEHAGLCYLERRCAVKANWQLINKAIRQTLVTMRLADIIRDQQGLATVINY
jgi:FeS assembly SUF system regulator